MLPRPKRGEDEDDILKLQEEFLKSKTKSAASVINKRRSESEDGSSQKMSTFAKNRALQKKKKKNLVPNQVVLGDIREKNHDQGGAWSFTSANTGQGFPEVFIRDKSITGKETSIFSQHMVTRENKHGKEESASSHMPNQKFSVALGEKSYIVSGPDALNIHKENVEKINNMSVDEIKSEQEKLQKLLKPEVLEFLKSRRKKADSTIVEYSSSPNNSTCMDVDEDNDNCASSESVVKKVTDSNIKSLVEDSSKCIHMDVLEEDKLRWTGDIPSVQQVPVDQLYSARFDFQGMLMPYISGKVDVRQGLYNHGDEPERPGYTLEELYQLSRSSVLQQRVIALNTLGSILEKARMGYYDECLQQGLLNCLLHHELFLLLRFSLDNNTNIQVVATLHALYHLLVSQSDEMCLDRILGCNKGFWQPSLSVISEIKPEQGRELKDEEDELKDHQILKLDIIKGALRTDMIPRLRYILEVIQPSPKGVIYALEILTRFVRHSYDTALGVVCCPRLLSTIISQFIPQDWSSLLGDKKLLEMQSAYMVPVVEALKLLKVIACRSRQFASDLVHKYDIFRSLITYISIDPSECPLPNKEVLRLILESFYLWQILLAYDLGSHHFVDLYPVFMRLLQFHYGTTSANDVQNIFGHEHATALINLIEESCHTAHCQDTIKSSKLKTLSYHHIKDFTSVVGMCLSKWLAQYSSTSDIVFSATKLVGATFRCIAALYHCSQGKDGVDIVKQLSNMEDFFKSELLSFMKSAGFQKALLSLRSSSCLLYEGEIGTKRDPSSLPSLGSVMWRGQHLTPVLQPTSPVPLLHGLAEFFLTAYNFHKALDFECLDLFLNNSVLHEYIQKINSHASAHLGNHWFTRLEVNMISTLLKLSLIQEHHKNDMFHLLAFSLVPLVQRDEKFLLKDIMGKVAFSSDHFKKGFLNISENLAAMKLTELSPLLSSAVSRTELITHTLENVSSLWGYYEEEFGLKNNSKTSCDEVANFTASDRGTELFLPLDWLYVPLIHLHNQTKSEDKIDAATTDRVVKALQWILLVEWLRPAVIKNINITNRFCRLSTVFLCGNDLFLDSQVHGLLAAALASLMQNNDKIKFSSSFYDLYTQLLEQFVAVSYGDALFGHFILVPLQQRHSVELRKQVWSEHAAILRVLTTSIDQLMFPFSELLEPCETDTSLLQSYLYCLASGTVRECWSPVLYWVAVHHLASFIKQYQDNQFGQQLRSKITKLGNEELKALLLNYKGPPTQK